MPIKTGDNRGKIPPTSPEVLHFFLPLNTPNFSVSTGSDSVTGQVHQKPKKIYFFRL